MKNKITIADTMTGIIQRLRDDLNRTPSLSNSVADIISTGQCLTHWNNKVHKIATEKLWNDSPYEKQKQYTDIALNTEV